MNFKPVIFVTRNPLKFSRKRLSHRLSSQSMKSMYTRKIITPIGPYVATSNGESLINLSPSDIDCDTSPDKVLDSVEQELKAYFDGTLTEFKTPIQLEGTEFSKKVWELLTQIPYGETWSYEELAMKAGGKNYSRAVASANGRNPISIIVPCHRVINKNGGLGGYNGGLDKKKYLLKLEGSQYSKNINMN